MRYYFCFLGDIKLTGKIKKYLNSVFYGLGNMLGVELIIKFS